MEIIGGLLIALIINIFGGAAVGTLAQPILPQQDAPREEQNIREELPAPTAPIQTAPDAAPQNETPSADSR